MQISSLSAEDAQLHKAPPTESARPTLFLDGAAPILDRSYRLAGLLLGNATEAERRVTSSVWRAMSFLLS